jgi:spore coat polysaccharide biosynthesis predicted glycosyltransferase SpsG
VFLVGFLDHQVLRNRQTALAFASTLDRNAWVVTWIRLEGDFKKLCEFDIFKDYEQVEILEEVDNSKQHIVFLDGYDLKGDNHSKIHEDLGLLAICGQWD